MLGVLVALLFTVQRIVLVNVWIKSTVPVSVCDRDGVMRTSTVFAKHPINDGNTYSLHQDSTHCLTAKSLDYSRNNGTT